MSYNVHILIPRVRLSVQMVVGFHLHLHIIHLFSMTDFS